MKKLTGILNKFVLFAQKYPSNLFCVFIIIIIIQCEISFAKIITVDDDGGADYSTIQAAVNFANDGDTVFVKAGIYKERIRIEKSIALLGEGIDIVYVMAEQNNAEPWVIILDGNCTIKGFTITSEDSLEYDGIYLNVRYKTVISNNKLTKLKNAVRILDSPIWGSKIFLSHCTNHDTCYIKIYGNQIINNQVGIYLDGVYLTGEPFDEDVIYDAKENWWGTSDSNDIKQGIFDWEPRAVDFSNWLNDEIKDQIEGQGNGIHQNNIYNNFEWNIYVAQDPVGVEENDMGYPKKNKLYQNYPNPFNPATTIRFDLPVNSFVTLKIFNHIGQEIATLVSSELSAGQHTVKWNANGLSGGVYFCKLQLGSLIETRKLVLLK